VTRIKLEVDRILSASLLGQAFTTHVAWAVSADGVFENLGEIAMDREKGRLEATTRFDQLGLLITAEPHYMVDRPSRAVVFATQNPRSEEIRRLTISAEVGRYDYSSIQIIPQTGVSNLTLEARAAFQIARAGGADRWAEAEFRAARVSLDTMEEMVSRASPLDIVSPTANEAIRRSQLAISAARARRTALELDAARTELLTLRQEQQALNARFQQLTQQQNAASAQLQRLQADAGAAIRDLQRMMEERDQAVGRERAAARELAELKPKQDELQMRLVLPLREEFFDLQASALTPAGREALARLCGIAEIVSGTIRLVGPAPDAHFDAARQFLLQAGIPQDRITLKR